MTIKARVENLDEISEGLRDAYVERDGVFVLSVDGMSHDSEWKGLQTSHETIKKEKKEIEQRYKSYKALGKTPEEIVKMEEEFKALKLSGNGEEMAKKYQAELESARTQIKQRYESENNELKSKVQMLTHQTNSNKIDRALFDGMTKLEANDNKKLLRDLLLPQMSVDENGQVFIKNDEGHPIMDKENYMSVDQILKSWKVDPRYKSLFGASQASGGGANPSGSANNRSGLTGGGGSGVIEIRTTDPDYGEKMAKYGHLIRSGKAVLLD